MNKRIKELIEQATSTVTVNHEGYMGRAYTSQEEVFDKEKFAELIVLEYETLLPEICPWADADKAGPMKGWHVAFVARKHFGVE